MRPASSLIGIRERSETRSSPLPVTKLVSPPDGSPARARATLLRMQSSISRERCPHQLHSQYGLPMMSAGANPRSSTHARLASTTTPSGLRVPEHYPAVLVHRHDFFIGFAELPVFLIEFAAPLHQLSGAVFDAPIQRSAKLMVPFNSKAHRGSHEHVRKRRSLEVGAECVSSARLDLCGGRPAMVVPTAINGSNSEAPIPVQEMCVHAQGLKTTHGGQGPRDRGPVPVAFCMPDGHRHPRLHCFRRSTPRLYAPCQRFAYCLTAMTRA
jgi:hypothetical protein